VKKEKEEKRLAWKSRVTIEVNLIFNIGIVLCRGDNQYRRKVGIAGWKKVREKVC